MAWLMFVTLKNVAVVSLGKPSVALLIADLGEYISKHFIVGI
jgi:hypothetical protein